MNMTSKHGISFFVAGVVLGSVAGYLAGSAGIKSQGLDLPANTPVTRFVQAPVRAAGPGTVSENPEGITGGEAAGRNLENPLMAPEAPNAGEVQMTPEQEALKQFMSVFDIEDPDAQTAAFQNVLAGITSTNAATYHKAWMTGPYERTSGGQEQMYNSHIGEVYGPVVVGMRDGTGPKDMMGAYSFVKDQFQGWIRTDPPSAEKWLDGLTFEPFRTAMESAWDETALASQDGRSRGK